AEVVATDGAGCSTAAKVMIPIKVNPPPTVTITPDNPYICVGASILLTASGAQTYSWSPVTGLDQSDIAAPTASPAVSTTYLVTAKDEIGCSNTATVSLY